MKKQLIIGLILLISLTMNAQNQKYDVKWKEVASFEEKSLPLSASKAVDDILKQAIVEKNSPQVIKSLIYKNKYKLAIDWNDNQGLIADLENLAKQSNNVAEKSLLHSMLAELYFGYYTSNRWQIDQRTNLADLVPTDMKEWSSNIFVDKTIENLELSKKEKDALKKHTTKEYKDIILLGKDAPEYYPTLYDFAMNRAILVAQEVANSGNKRASVKDTGCTIEQLTLPADEYVKLNINKGEENRAFIYYQEYFNDLLSRKLMPAIIKSEIDKVSFIGQISNKFDGKERYNALEKLANKYKEYDLSVEIINALATDGYGFNDELAKEIRYNWCVKGIQDYPNYKRIGILKKNLEYLEQPSLKIQGEPLAYPNEDIMVSIQHQNIQAVNRNPLFKLFQQKNGKDIFIKDFPEDLVSTKTYLEDTLKLNIGKLDNGAYRLTYVATNAKDNGGNNFQFKISRLATFSRNSGKDEYEIFVLDRMSGKPVEGARVEVTASYYENSKQQKIKTQLETNQLGLALFRDKNRGEKKHYYPQLEYRVTLGNDLCLDKGRLNGGNNYFEQPQPRNDNKQTISIFTDRNIYRPGQTVFFKAIVLDNNEKIIGNKSLDVELYNANGEKQSTKKLTTNEFGSVAGEFILPKNGLTGTQHIRIGESNAYFTVEEYKRPTFEIVFDSIKDTYTFGQEVKLRGRVKSFSGISLQNVDVKYAISRQERNFWWRSFGGGSGELFDDGSVATKEDGSFEISFTPEAADTRNHFRNNVFTFNISTRATDINGETQVGDYAINVGNVSMIINIDLPEKIEKTDKSELKITAENLQGQLIETSGSYTLYTVNEKDSVQNKVSEGLFKTGAQSELMAKLKQLPSAKYQLQLKAKDDKGNEVDSKKDFILYSFDDTKPPIKTNNWLITKNTKFGKDKPAEILFGVSDKDVYVLYQIQRQDTVFERNYITLSEANKTFSIPYKDEYKDEAYVSLTLIKNGEFVNEDIQLTKEKSESNTKLDIKLDVFRDKLRPGQAETWTLSVKDGDKAASAEMLASMYDVSLDKLYPSAEWLLQPPYLGFETSIPTSYNYSFYRNNYPRSINVGSINRAKRVKPLSFDRINWFNYPFTILSYSSNQVNVLFSVADLAEDSSTEYDKVPQTRLRGIEPSLASPKAMKQTVGIIKQESAPMLIAEREMIGGTGANTPPQIRRNFNETAFFYPQLRTNDKGETLISFTAPESNTTWKLRALAHDKDGRWGSLQQLVVTRKELMVTPNLPRFVREGDKTSISTKISNLSENVVSGEVYIELFDPITEKLLNIDIDAKQQSFSLAKDASSSAQWLIKIPSGVDMIGCRIVAKSQTFSDGEQHVLSVLPNRMLVTESMPIDVNTAGRSEFVFDKMADNKSQSLDNYRLTLEFASNPAWYAVQALPTLSNPSNENAVNWFAAYYVNTLGASIVQQYPKVAAMIEAWKKQGGNKETLVSKLQQNEELKSVLLEETPWVLEAKDETEQMQRLSLLFDLNNTKQLAETATRKLADLQTGEGAWVWYKGMNPSRSISQYILYGYAQLRLTGQVEYPNEVKQIQINALKYVDSQIKEDFAKLKKNNKDWAKTAYISTSQLEYLFVRSSYRDIPVDQETRQAERFYTEVASTHWTNLNLYERSLLSVVSKRNGNKELASQLAKSIAEHSKMDKSLGMYWPNNRSNVFMSLSGVSTHLFLMNALIENGASENEINAMKQWLVKQKQTQVWESTHATIDAVDMLLRNGSDWFAEGGKTEIKVGKKEVDSRNAALGSGYVQQAWTKAEMTTDMAKVEIDKKENHPAYGALYWQYYEDLNKITSGQTSELGVSKQLFVEVVDANGKSMKQVTDNSPLKIGDKVIVRLTVRADRNMEFVSLKDLRASCFEPLDVVSGTKWQNSLLYYQSTKDASTNFYFDFVPKGTYVMEYPLFVTRSGEYSNGITTIQCLYAPEFISHTAGLKVIVR